MSLTSEGMKTNTKSTTRMAIGSNNNMKGGGGNGGRITGRMSSEAVRHSNTSNDSILK